MTTAMSINLNGYLLDLSTPRIMGILNVTPDSFFDGGQFQKRDHILPQVEKMLQEGADIIDVGGMSSRPGANIISEQEELDRVLKVVEWILEAFPTTPISIDTVRSGVANACIQAGAAMVNDISAGAFDANLYQTVADLQVPYVLMHMQGKPENMQKAPTYEQVPIEVLDFMIAQVGRLRELGVHDVIIDPGFGFGKTVEHNFELLRNLAIFKILDCPILAGVSRKSMINRVLKTRPETALNGTTAAHMLALQNGASILRVHDVLEAKQAIQIWQAYEQAPIVKRT